MKLTSSNCTSVVTGGPNVHPVNRVFVPICTDIPLKSPTPPVSPTVEGTPIEEFVLQIGEERTFCKSIFLLELKVVEVGFLKINGKEFHLKWITQIQTLPNEFVGKKKKNAKSEVRTKWQMRLAGVGIFHLTEEPTGGIRFSLIHLNDVAEVVPESKFYRAPVVADVPAMHVPLTS